ncbi:MAG: hypothetical protein ACI9J3_003573 [Parvicellaceae bacterium]|jgi:hypothetical protein
MKFSKEVTINAPAEKVWDIVGHNFADIGKYDGLVSSSVINHDLPKLNGSPYGGRVCESSFGTINEKFIEYDEGGMTFSFQGDIKSPVFSNVINTVAVIAVNETTSKIIATPNVDLTFLGKVMFPLIRLSLGSAVGNGLLDLKYFAENDKVSPRKLASQK